MPKRDRPIRNHAALSPLLRKGGVHTKSNSCKRVKEKHITDIGIDEWWDEKDDTNSNQRQESGEQVLPFFCLKSKSVILNKYLNR